MQHTYGPLSLLMRSTKRRHLTFVKSIFSFVCMWPNENPIPGQEQSVGSEERARRKFLSSQSGRLDETA